MALEISDDEILRRLIRHSEDLAEIKTTVTRLDNLLGNGGGVVRRVDANRETCDRRETERLKDKREIWDYIKTHKVKSLAIASGSAGTITAIFEGIKQLWHLAH